MSVRAPRRAPVGAEAASPAGAPAIDVAAVTRILESARFRDEGVLLETEGMALLDAIGVGTPRRIFVPDASAIAALEDPPLPAERVVLKIVAPRLLHKTEAGGVRVLPADRGAVLAAARDMERRLSGERPVGFVLYEYVAHAAEFGHEFLLGLRWTRDFGPVVSLGPGGVHAEFLARALRDREGLAMFSPELLAAADAGGGIERALAALAPARRITQPQRGRPAELPAAALAAAVRSFLALAASPCARALAELEVNPLVASHGRLVALDALATLARGREPVSAPRPLDKVNRLLVPRSIALVGVSEKMNPGRIILRNVLREGFDPAAVTVIKPGCAEIDGCRCVPTLADLPAPVDVVVLAVSAAQSAEILADIAAADRAASVVLIPSGLEEKEGAEELVRRMHDALRRARSSPGRGPVVNGGNCLGLRSVPGRYNTLFIPEHKLPVARGAADPVALIAGSGAFAVAQASKLAGMNLRYTLTIGNQMDLTVADYLEVLERDPAIEVFAVYLEGFRAGDGARFLEVAARIAASGRAVILYWAGRTQAGAAAAASHTAAVAGDALVTRRLCEAAGVVVADSLDDFEDLVRLFVHLRGVEAHGLRLGALSNAGFECVAIADSLGSFSLAPFAPETRADIAAVIAAARLSDIVSVRNPIDLTPILADEGYEAVTRAILDDPGVDVAVVGCVPLTGALDTLAAGPGHGDDLEREDGIVRRLIRLRRESRKPWVAVVDAGRLYDPMVRALQDGGIPTFRTADRALRLFGIWCRQRGASRD